MTATRATASPAISAAYVDSSVLVALAFGEASATRAYTRLSHFDVWLSSPLLEAELASAHKREQVVMPADLLAAISFVCPSRPLSAEIAQVLQAGYVRGADCLHLATALYVAPNPSELTFFTLDVPQRKVAATLGFAV